MNSKNIILVVDNRQDSHGVDSHCTEGKNVFKGSGFKATEIDALDQIERKLTFGKDCSLLSLLQEKITKLEERVQFLLQNEHFIRRRKRNRRKNNQIEKEYECPIQECGKYYGSQTSLKNHIKIKHNKERMNINEGKFQQKQESE